MLLRPSWLLLPEARPVYEYSLFWAGPETIRILESAPQSRVACPVAKCDLRHTFRAPRVYAKNGPQSFQIMGLQAYVSRREWQLMLKKIRELLDHN